MRIRRGFIILSLIIAITALFGDYEGYAARKAQMAPGFENKAILSAQNDTIKVQLDDIDGQFNIGKRVGNVTLTYAFPSSPWSSWTVLYIDGVPYSSDFGAGTNPTGSVQLGSGSVTFPFSIVPHSGDSSYIHGGWWQDSVSLYQTLMPVYVEHDTFKDAFIYIKYQAINHGPSSHVIGIMLQLDTMLDSNDAAELTTVWSSADIEDSWEADSVPPWWYAWETGPPLASPSDVMAMGILDGFDAVKPDKFAVGSWGNFHNALWGYSTTGTTYWDSAVLYWWGLDTIAPGDTLVGATYYGIGHPFMSGDFTFVVDEIEVENCVYSPNPFDFFVLFTNSSAAALNNPEIHIDLPTGLVLATGSEDTLLNSGSPLSSFSSATMSWDIAIAGPPVGDSIRVWVTSSSTADTFEAWYILSLPDIGPPPEAFAITPIDSAWTTCADQNIAMEFYVDNGLATGSDINFNLNGSPMNLTDTELSWIDDTLWYVPSSNWSDGDIVSWGLLGAVDEVGCSLVTPVYGSFNVDISPPIAENEWPEDGAVLGTTDIPEVWVELYDVIRSVDESSIVFVCQDDTFDISSTELSYLNDSLFFDLDAAGIELADGDTLCLEIVSAADPIPDYCEPNVMDSYDWCFSVNVIDLWLPDTHLCPPGDTFDIPVYIQDVTGLGIEQVEISIDFFDEIIQPIGLELGGSICSGWSSMSHTISDNNINVEGSGTELVGGGVLFYIKFFVPTVGAEGSYSILDFQEATFNDGELNSKAIDGFTTVCFSNHIWTNDIVFTAGEQNRRVLTFGATSSGSDNYDAGLDIQAIPPPGSHVDGYFDLADPAYPFITELIRDIKNSDELPITWTGYAGAPGTGEVTVLWNPGHFPDGSIYMTYIDDGITKNVDMRHNDRVTFEDETEFTIVYDQPEIGMYEIQTCVGWNLLSFPFVPNGTINIEDAIPGAITSGYAFDPISRSYRIMDSIEPGVGFWVYCTEAATFRVAGMLIDEVDATVYPGWNLVGVPYKATGLVPMTSMALDPDVLVTGNIFGFDACGTGAYYSPSDFEVGQGYWMLASGESHLTISGDSTLSKLRIIPEPEWTLKLDLNDDNLIIGIDDKAQVGMDEYDRAIPPVNPDGGEIFGMKVDGYNLSRDVRPTDKAEFAIAKSGLLSWNPEAIPANIELLLVNGDIMIDMSEYEQFNINMNAKIVVNRVLPNRAELYSARPNPFNPITEISFYIPNNEIVKIDVYDITGNKIRNLTDSEFEAGDHSLIWNGEDSQGKEMPSGMYFYNMSVSGSSIVQTKRMILIR